MQPCHAEVPILIPAYKPGEALVDVVNALLARGASAIVVVDDGGGPTFQPIFQRISGSAAVHVVHHAVNLGKGAALKTGMNYALWHFPNCCGVVSADADGQHHADDILRVADKLRANPGALAIGVRAFGKDVPMRSKIGNEATRVLMRLLTGQKLTDTQTGLRGIPAHLIPHLLRVPATGYEFELDMLIACKHQSCPIVEEPIKTIYIEDNRSSHFHPVLDSMRIYFLLFRSGIVSLATAVMDNIVFVVMFSATGSIGVSQIVGRAVAMCLNYMGARRVVFHSRQRHSVVFPKYAALVVCSGLLSYGIIEFLHSQFGVRPISAKLLTEGLLFIANFAIQRDFVFTRRPAKSVMDWEN